MEELWKEDSAHGRFWAQLIQENADQRMLDKEYLKRLRYRHDLAKEDQKRFGHIWARHNTNIYKLIASACGEVWDNEDEEKGGHLKKVAPMEVKEKPNALRVDRPRQERVREREEQGDVVQGRDDRREEDLQAQGRRFFGGGSSPEKAPP